jgi:predicted ATPase/DNA-binding SARP family transcriptional activator/uncharacterized protein HemY
MELRWQITVLGRLRAEREGGALAYFRRQKTGILLAYLAYYLHRTHPRDALIDLLWPDADPSAGRASLSVALSFLRQHLEPPGWPPGSVLIADRSSVRLNPDAIATDVAAFEAALQEASRAPSQEEQFRWLTEAASWYQGELLPGCYDEWALLERERLSEAYVHALTQLLRLLEAEGDLSRALNYARRAVSADPLREESHQELIRLLGAAGQAQAARRQFAELERLLKEELDATPSDETRALVEAPRSRLPPGSAYRPPGSRAGKGERAHVSPGSVPLSLPRAESQEPGAGRRARSALPSGTVTFLLTEIEGGVALWERLGSAAPLVRESHHALFRRLLRRHGGCEVSELGDGFVFAFQGAGDALACAVALQSALVSHSWPPTVEPLPAPLRVRAALHTGEAQPEQGEYPALVLHPVQQLLASGHGRQILCSETTATLLRRDLEPGARLLDLGVYLLPGLSEPERLFQVEYPGMEPGSFPPLRAEARPSGHLPPSFTRFFGREKERARLEKLLASEQTRLVTLMGPGGSGKTRLALEVARQLVEGWQGAVWFVPLADVSEAKRIPDAVRQALSLSPSATQEPLDQVAEVLADRPALLLLDNLEHLLPEGATLVRELMERAPSLTCLVTSRRRLTLSGERLFSVPPLPTPRENQSPEQLLECESVQLFLDRAQATSLDFALTEQNAGAVGALCRRLEGLPLAIELAAARAGVLSPGQILSQLERGLGVLASRQADVAERHRSLRGTVEWSYRLLDSTLQEFFVGLSVFRGGFSLEAAEAVSEEELALDYMEQLRECSLVLTEEPGAGMRFRLLETLREYGREQLGEEEWSELKRRHATYFLTWSEQAHEEVRQGHDQQSWLERLEVEHDNLRAAVGWAVEKEEIEIGLRLAVVLASFWETRGYFSEGREQLAAVLALTDSSDAGEDMPHSLHSLRAQTLRNAGALAWRQGEYEPARSLLEASLAMQQARDDKLGVVSVLHMLGAVTFNQGDFAASRAFGAQALAIAREAGSTKQIAICLYNLGNVASGQSDYETAKSLFMESLAVFRDLGDRFAAAHALHGLGNVSLHLGDWVAALSFLDEALAIRRELGHRAGVGESLHSLGYLARGQGDHRAAQIYLEESLAIRREIGDRRGIGMSLCGLGMVASQQGDEETAQALLEESLAIHRRQGDRHMAACSMAGLGALMSRRGDVSAARALLEESLAIYREADDPEGAGMVLCSLGTMAADQGDMNTAATYYRDSLAAHRDVGDRLGMAEALEGLARISGARKQPQHATQLYSSAVVLREALGAPVPPADRAAYERQVDAVRACLGEEAFASAWAEGRVMTLEEAVACALALKGSP